VTHLPVLSGRELVKSLASLGYQRSHERGSHIILRKSSPPHLRLTVPDHPAIAKGTLAAIAREMGMTAPELADYVARV
jgi:predicted RNA binding protein YcfA (HicA-like mRNA interferase family)